MCHALIIEDEPLIAEYVGELAIEAGASTLSFATTELEAVQSAVSSKPRVILSDVRLAVGTGPAAVRTITRKLGHIPVIFITGSPADIDDDEGSRSIVLNKPIQPATVLKAFRTAISQPT